MEIVAVVVIVAFLSLMPAPQHQDSDAEWRRREEDSMK